MNLAKENPDYGKITKQCRTMISKKPGGSKKVHVFGLLGTGNCIGLTELFYKHSEVYLTNFICKSQNGGSLFRIKKSLFLEKIQTSTVSMGRIKAKCEIIYKKLEREVRKMKKSTNFIEDSLKKALDEKN